MQLVSVLEAVFNILEFAASFQSAATVAQQRQAGHVEAGYIGYTGGKTNNFTRYIFIAYLQHRLGLAPN